MEQQATKKRVTWAWITLAILGVLPLYFLFAHFGEPGNGRVAGFLAGMLLIAMKMRWELRRHPWFWWTVALIIAVETPLVVFVPWTNSWIPAAVIFPFCVLDFIGIFWLFQVVERWMAPSKSG